MFTFSKCDVCHKVSTRFHVPLTSPFRVLFCVLFVLRGSSGLPSPVVLFVWHHNRQRNDVLCLLHRGHVNHAATEGESTLSRFTTDTRAERETLDQTCTVNALKKKKKNENEDEENYLWRQKVDYAAEMYF